MRKIFAQPIITKINMQTIKIVIPTAVLTVSNYLTLHHLGFIV